MNRVENERGAALITVLLVAVMVAGLAAVSAQLAASTITRSGGARDSVAAAHAAEAGINHALAALATAAGSTWCGQPAGADTMLPSADGVPSGQQWAVTVSDSAGVAGVCQPTDPVRVIRATGYSPFVGAPGAVRRAMESQVRLVPISATANGAFNFGDAIFANSATDPLTINNSVNIMGDGGGNNADVYSNDDSLFLNSNEVHGDLVVQGDVTLNNSVRVYGSVTARGNITMQNSAQVDGSVTSATGSISLVNSARVNGNATAATTITTTNSSTILGARYSNTPTSPPQQRSLPAFNFNGADAAWPAPVVTHADCAAFNTYLNANINTFKGTHRITSNCETALTNSTEVKVVGKTAIVTDGWIRMRNSSKFTAQGSGYELWLISLHAATDASDTRGIAMENSSTVEGMPVFLFARNQVTKGNSVAVTGQIYANKVATANSFTLTFKSLAPPGFTFQPGEGGTSTVTGFGTRVLYLREIKPS